MSEDLKLDHLRARYLSLSNEHAELVKKTYEIDKERRKIAAICWPGCEEEWFQSLENLRKKKEEERIAEAVEKELVAAGIAVTGRGLRSLETESQTELSKVQSKVRGLQRMYKKEE